MAAEAASFGLLVRRHRLALGLTQEELAERAGLSPRVISEIERGGPHVPRKDTVALLVASLGLRHEERVAFEAAARPRPPAVAAPQMMARGLQTGAPPLPLTALIGREQEVTALTEMLGAGQVRLITLTGPGGVGKTRLALQVVAGVDRARFADGVCFVALDALGDPALVATTIAGALELREGGSRPAVEVLSTFLRDKRLLLVLDNFEHLLAAAPLVSTLLGAAPGLGVLVTSRIMLRLYGEQEVAVPPLAVPDQRQFAHPAVLAQVAAVVLFTQRARLVAPGFALDAANASAVAEICLRLDGLPLAIELAAARSKLLPPPTLLARLSNRLGLLTGGARDLPARQQTLRATIEWSYALLDAEERHLLARLSVFAGGCTLEAAEAICGPEGPTEDGEGAVLEGLASLVDMSLLRQTGVAGEVRFAMLETIREYAREHLEESAEAPALHRRHAAYYLALAREAAPGLEGEEQVIWLDRLERDLPNLRAAGAWLAEHGGVEEALHLEGVLCYFWSMRGDWEESRSRLEGLLARPEAAARTSGRARALFAAGFLTESRGRRQEGQALYDECLAISQEIGDQKGIARALFGLAQAGDDDLARARFETCLARARAVGDLYIAAWSLWSLSGILTVQGNLGEAQALLGEAIAIQRALGDRWGLACSLLSLARSARGQRNLAAARSQTEEALALVQELGARDTVASALAVLGSVALDEGDHIRAHAHYTETLTIWREMGEQNRTAHLLRCFVALAAGEQHHARALRLAGAAAVLDATIGSWDEPFGQVEWEGRLTQARQGLSDEEAAAAWAEGGALTATQALAYALQEDLPR